MKKFFICFLVCFVAVLALNFSVYAVSGDGTGENPFLIGSDGDILVIKSFPDKHYKLISDVNLNTSLGDFSGVLDGNGYKITSESKANIIFASNSGTVKNLTANCRLAKTNTESGVVENCVFNNTSGVVGTNNGIIENSVFNNTYCISGTNNGVIKNSKCVIDELKFSYKSSSGGGITPIAIYGIVRKNCASGIIVGCSFVCNKLNVAIESSYITLTFGGFAYENAGKISECYSNFNMEYSFYNKTYDKKFSGIAINTDENAVIENCYVIANVETSTSEYTNFGGITLDLGNVKNCYSVINGSVNAGDYYGVGGKNIENSYYMSTSLSQDSTYGVSASETAMKMRALYANWDFENVWGIDSSINDGFPYLRRFYDGSDLPNVSDYTINSMTITDENNAPLDTIPENSDCYAEVSVTKNTERNEKDYIIIAMYDENGNLADVSYMRAFFIKDQTATFGKSFNTKGIKKIKSFIWSENLSLTPLSNYCVKQ